VEEDTSDVVAKNFPICQRTIGCRPHRTQITPAEFGTDRNAGQFAVGTQDFGFQPPPRPSPSGTRIRSDVQDSESRGEW